VQDVKTLSLEEAQRAVEAALAAARTVNRRICCAVVDHNGDLLACARMDGLVGRYIKAAQRKAYTAAVFTRDTLGLRYWWKEKEEEGHQGPHDWNDPMLTTLPGGFAVVHDDQVVGGIGCSGGTFDVAGTRDVDFAEAALGALGQGFKHQRSWA
jgi:glc operon protein GlcG